MVIDFVIVTAPKPPGSSTSISPHVAVLLIAPAKVLQGAVRLHGFASSPTPDTHVRVACALSEVAMKRQQRIAKTNRTLFLMKIPPLRDYWACALIRRNARRDLLISG